MKDEIIKNIIYRLDCKSPTAYDGIELSKEESNSLLDYITNLQEENKRLNNIINELEKELDSDDWTSVNGVITVKILKHKLEELKKVGNKIE